MFVNLALEGGGIKGLAYVGALKCLEDHGINVFKASGSSVGALFAGLIIAGFRSKEIADEIEKLDLESILKKNSFLTAIKSLGMNNIEALELEIDKLLAKKNKYTFADVKYGSDYLLKIIVTRYKTREMFVMPNDFIKMNLAPEKQKISKAIAMSCSMPGLFSVYKYKDKFFGDGGLVNNLPINVLDNSLPIFALRIKDDDKLVSNSSDITKGIHIINIDTLGIKTIDFKKGIERRKDLYVSGYNSVRRYLQSLKNR